MKHPCSLPAPRPTSGLQRGAYPPAAARSAAKNWARSISHCCRTPPYPPPALSVFPSAPAESHAGHPPCHLAPRLRSGGWFPEACALAATCSCLASCRGTSQRGFSLRDHRESAKRCRAAASPQAEITVLGEGHKGSVAGGFLAPPNVSLPGTTVLGRGWGRC